jgi:hypothetical protein
MDLSVLKTYEDIAKVNRDSDRTDVEKCFADVAFLQRQSYSLGVHGVPLL